MVSASANGSSKKRKDALAGEEGSRKGRLQSCVPCRRRKLRCSREEICSNCIKYKVECLWDDCTPSRTEEDAKLEASQTEVLRLNRIVLGLEERLARLELQQPTSPASPSTPESASSQGSLRSALDNVSLRPRTSSAHTCSRGSMFSSLDPTDLACTTPIIYPPCSSSPYLPSTPAFVPYSQPPPGIPYFPSQHPSAESLPPSLSASSSSSSLYSSIGMPPAPAAAPPMAPFGWWTMFAAADPSAQGLPTVQERSQEDGHSGRL